MKILMSWSSGKDSAWVDRPPFVFRDILLKRQTS